jgi:hypothetical protein
MDRELFGFGVPRKVFDVAERIPVSGYEIALAVLDVGERTETVNLQLEDVVVGVERFRAA